MQFKTKRKRKVLINITSLIDVLFLLLIFVMVSSTFLEQPAIELQLPEAKSAVVLEQKEYTLFVDKEGKVFLNNNQVVIKDLEEKLKEALPRLKDKFLFLKADQDVSHGTVVKIMDIVKKCGVKRLSIGTRLK